MWWRHSGRSTAGEGQPESATRRYPDQFGYLIWGASRSIDSGGFGSRGIKLKARQWRYQTWSLLVTVVTATQWPTRSFSELVRNSVSDPLKFFFVCPSAGGSFWWIAYSRLFCVIDVIVRGAETKCGVMSSSRRQLCGWSRCCCELFTTQQKFSEVREEDFLPTGYGDFSIPEVYWFGFF